MRVLIVDDEPLARRGVSLRLSQFPRAEVVGDCGDGPVAVAKILELQPDVVFLDVQMPGMDGFDVLRALPPDLLPGIIFLTAHEQHALRAFDVHALDYLLKPVDDERFAAAVERAIELTDAQSRAHNQERLLQLLLTQSGRYPRHFTVRLGSKLQIVPVNDIEWIAAADSYTELHTRGRRYLLRESMASLEQKLEPSKFLRIHRSRLVRNDCIVELVNIDNGEYRIRLTDGSEHRSSRTYTDRLEKWLQSGRLG
jgi:two-component system LytT family response regulator